MRTLNIGTQEVGLGEVDGLRCACRRKLIWKAGEGESEAECRCGMVYVASEPLVRIEGREDESSVK